jgi:pyridoxal phosphate enzyme (YggS family)
MAPGKERCVSDIVERLEAVKTRMAAACRRAGRPLDSVCLVAVAKRQPNDYIRIAYRAGQRDFGENYMQELTAKAAELSDLEGIRWRFVGHLQRNKVKEALRVCHSIDTVDSVRLAEALHRRAVGANRPIEAMIQVNVGSEQQKAGCAIEQVESLAGSIRALDAISLRGLMAIPPAEADPEQCRPWFRRLRVLAVALGLPELSMGMSDDMEVAIEEGATMIRVGTAIFGPRPPISRK